MNIDVHVMRVKRFWVVNYCYLIVNTATNSAVLIDPAWEQTKIEKQIAERKTNLEGILLTHCHPDHVHLSSPLAKKYDVPVFMSQVEIDFYHFSCTNLIPIESFKPFELGSIQIKPLFTPGHTQGGTSYLIENNLFCGDTLFIEGCGLCTGKGASASALFDTLQMFKEIISPRTIIYPGHSYGQPVGQSFEYLLKNNIYLHFKNKEDFTAFRMRKNQTDLFNFK